MIRLFFTEIQPDHEVGDADFVPEGHGHPPLSEAGFWRTSTIPAVSSH